MKTPDRSTYNGLAFSWVLSLAVACPYVYLSLQNDLRLSIPALIGCSAVVVMSLSILLYAGERGQLHLPPGVILFFAILFRLLFVFRAPELSDDIYRYLWDGLQTLRGVNPYSLAPAGVEAYDVGSAVLLSRVNHPALVTIYPPVSQIVFAAGAALSHSLAGMKIILGILDIATCAVILHLLHRLGLPAWRATLYAWHPLPVIEIAGSGHIDGVGILLSLVTILILVAPPQAGSDRGRPVNRSGSSDKLGLLRSFQPGQRTGFFNWGKRLRSFTAGFVFSASVLVKEIPIFFLPVLLLSGPRRMVMLLGFASGLIALSAPFMPDLYHMFVTLGVYLQDWEFSNFFFRLLRRLSLSGNCVRLALAALFVACVLYQTFVFGKKRPRDTQKVIGDAFKAQYVIVLAFLLLTPTLHPWYALYLVAFFPFVVGPAGLVLSWAVFLSYGVLIEYGATGRWIESDIAPAAMWFSPVFAYLMSKVAERTGL